MLTPLFFASATLVVASGWAKLRHPGPGTRALQGLGLPFRHRAVRAIGTVELVVGLACLVEPGRPFAVALAVLYAGFAGFLILVIRANPPGASCGCLGDREARPSRLHVFLDVGGATVAAVVAVAPPPGIVPFSAQQPLLGVPFLLGTGLIAYLAYLAAAYLPELFTAYAGRTSGPAPPSQPPTFTVGRGSTP